jgi:hypothetical protein
MPKEMGATEHQSVALSKPTSFIIIIFTYFFEHLAAGDCKFFLAMVILSYNMPFSPE